MSAKSILDNPEKLVMWAALGLVAYVVLRGPAGVGKDAVRAVSGAASGAVIGIGGALGIPETKKTQCQIDKAKNDKWAASFSCSAGDYIDFLINGYTATTGSKK